MDNNMIMFLIVSVFLAVLLCRSTEGFEPNSGADPLLDYTCTNPPHLYATKQWREDHYDRIISPSPLGYVSYAPEPEAEAANGATEGFTDNLGNNSGNIGNYGNISTFSPFNSACRETIDYTYSQQDAMKVDGTKELIAGYYVDDKYPYTDYESWDCGDGRYRCLRY